MSKNKNRQSQKVITMHLVNTLFRERFEYARIENAANRHLTCRNPASAQCGEDNRRIELSDSGNYRAYNFSE